MISSVRLVLGDFDVNGNKSPWLANSPLPLHIYDSSDNELTLGQTDQLIITSASVVYNPQLAANLGWLIFAQIGIPPGGTLASASPSIAQIFMPFANGANHKLFADRGLKLPLGMIPYVIVTASGGASLTSCVVCEAQLISDPNNLPVATPVPNKINPGTLIFN